MPTRLAATIAFLLGVIVAVEAATTVTVGQHGMVFTQSSASLARGDRIVFTNEDDVIHNIHIFGPGNPSRRTPGRPRSCRSQGRTLTYRFDKAGAYRVRCNIHPSVKMAVNVK